MAPLTRCLWVLVGPWIEDERNLTFHLYASELLAIWNNYTVVILKTAN